MQLSDLVFRCDVAYKLIRGLTTILPNRWAQRNQGRPRRGARSGNLHVCLGAIAPVRFARGEVWGLFGLVQPGNILMFLDVVGVPARLSHLQGRLQWMDPGGGRAGPGMGLVGGGGRRTFAAFVIGNTRPGAGGYFIYTFLAPSAFGGLAGDRKGVVHHQYNSFRVGVLSAVPACL
ncbi:jg19869 [Pararge aegeria aegeria]|uniref:Jg19869 protein n=1 Tax=Pararge aegeria aegeria TaxID=348720 RepID=A0A8S4QW75_9NEOP|nr:jg19869 [Pararge aegeria aegeria]